MYSNSDVVLTAPAQKHLSPEEYHTQAFKQEELPGAAVLLATDQPITPPLENVHRNRSSPLLHSLEP